MCKLGSFWQGNNDGGALGDGGLGSWGMEACKWGLCRNL